MRLLTVLGLCFSFSVFANECSTTLVTLLGNKGAVTVVLTPAGQLETWQDGFVPIATGREAKFAKTGEPFPAGRLNGNKTFAGALLGDGSQRMLAAVENNGLLNLITPLGRSYPFLPSEMKDVTAIAFRTSADQKNISLFAVAGNRLYRLKMKWRRIDDADRVLQLMLMKGLVRVTESPALFPGQKLKINYTTPQVELFDFSGDAKYLLGSLDPRQALEVTRFEKIHTFRDETEMSRIDHLSILDDHRAVVASRFGQVLIIDYVKNENILKLTFNEPVLVSSLSAHLLGDKVQVWAIGEGRGALYHWNTDSAGNWFQNSPAPCPDGVVPVRISTASFEATPAYAPGAESYEGYFSNVTLVNGRPTVERILVLGSDGNLYGYIEPLEGIALPGFTERKWVKAEAAMAPRATAAGSP